MSNALIEFEASSIKDLNKFLDGVPESNKIQYALTTHLIKEYPDSLRAELSGVRVNEKPPISATIGYNEGNSKNNSLSGNFIRVTSSGIYLRTDKGGPPKYLSYSIVSSPEGAPQKVVGGKQHITQVTIAAELVYREAIIEDAIAVKKVEKPKKRKKAKE